MASSTRKTTSDDWVRIRRDQETGIESVHAHFRGHAYDPHDHDEVLVGVTLQGVQRFHCHRSLHTSTPGRAILIEPGAVHDGHAPAEDGFTYAMLYLPQSWVAEMLQRLGQWDICAIQPAFRSTLTADAGLSAAIRQAFLAVHHGEGRLARDQSLDRMMGLLSRHLSADAQGACDSAARMARARDFLHDQMERDVGLDELAGYAGMDRFRLTRQFQRSFGLSPHAYLIRLRLRVARALLANGQEPADVAIKVGFADQSHLGRWFKRAYRLTPAAYKRLCAGDAAQAF
ncbi:AraC family transcriptional regulator [Xanthomonas sp. NCPPB 2654]|uniref:AraC family transcriptional regulator n=1 Tax=unclassified Xanthomonas TaxID=2643310 RepID=UPI0021E00D8D|nr:MULTISPECIES: AraC family transcriptional regulator [unclassified Xanthomonas]MDL5365894.1 AraC family transcriptional regulator [Xanthomonas sp. NCPPB 2654]UYC20539.1 AraC family transcriptional regulator [Xanthomonas sp. CFBP 8443]